MNTICAISPETGRGLGAARFTAPARERRTTAFAGPRCLAGYRLQAVLGRGRRSVVYLAQEPHSHRSVALKLVQRADLESAGRAGDFSREFSLLAALASPCVVQVFDHGVASRQAFLSMEVLSGGNVAQRVGRLAVSDAIAILRHAACALAQVHRGGWVHRDVKPANLLLRADGSLALGDFGCARRQGELDRLAAGAVLGTPLYAAPEQSQGAPADPAADVYSLGILFHQLLTGKPPYSGMTLTELLCQHLMAPLPRLPREYGAWQPLLDAMLAKDPRGRLADGQAVLEHLQHARHDTMDPS